MRIRIIATGIEAEHGDLFPNISFPNNRPQPDWMVANGVEEVILPPPPPHVPTTDELVANMTAALEHHYDQVARVKKYDNRLTCALRAGYAGPFQSEGTAFAIWMDNCNAYGYGVMEAVMKSERAIPTADELIAELPAAPW